MAAGIITHPGKRLQERGDGDRGMIHQTLTNTGQIVADLYAHLVQMSGRTDTGPHQMCRGVDSTRRQDHLVGAELDFLALDPGFHADTF